MSTAAGRTTVLIMGAAGRDFHDFNVAFRDRPEFEVVAFTAAQIPNIAGRVYPPALAGALYPRGIPIVPESDLEALVERRRVDEVVFAYSDLSHEEVMHRASRALARGASFRLLGPRETMLASKRPVVSVCAVRTGAGKSAVARRVTALIRERGLRVAVVRHPMPYGDLERQAAQRFASLDDLAREGCTIEEREEYEPHLERGAVVFAGVDTGRVLRAADLPAMGYGEEQVRELEETIRATPCEVVVVGTPIDLARVVRIDRPAVRVRYDAEERGAPTLADALEGFLRGARARAGAAAAAGGGARG
jgi:predicted GTPase